MISREDFIFAIGFDLTHKFVGNANRDIKINDLVFIRFTGDEFFDIGMVNTQDTHVGAASRPALGDLTKSMIVNPQETYRTGSLPRRRFYQRTLWSDARE